MSRAASRPLRVLALAGALALPALRLGDQRPGYPIALASFAMEMAGTPAPDSDLERAMAAQGWHWEGVGRAPAELAGGRWASLDAAGPPPLVRAHALTKRELVPENSERLVARVLRAIEERTVQVIVLRPIPGGAPVPLQRDAIRHALKEEGILPLERLGILDGEVTEPLEPGATAWPWPTGLTGPLALALSALSWLCCSWLLVGAAGDARRVAAVAGAAAVAWGLWRAPGWEPGVVSAASVSVLWLGGVAVARQAAAGRWWRALGWALLSGLVAGTLLWAWWPYRLGVIQPVGVRLGLALPVALAVLWRWRAAPPDRRQAVITVAGLAALAAGAAWAILRSRDAGWVFPYELEMREWLEAAFPARPRTRELLGYPAAAWMAARGAGQGWGVVLTGLGATALATTQNTFLHTTTPLVHNGVREALGVGIGLAIPFLLLYALLGPRRAAREA